MIVIIYNLLMKNILIIMQNEAVEITFKYTVCKLLNAFYASFYRHVRKFGFKQMNHEK